MRRIELQDGRQILVIEPSGLPDLVRRGENASVVLVHVDEAFSKDLVEQLAALHALGCNRFLCSGTLSERLHDALDERLLEREDADEVMTTFHAEDEPLDDVVALFLEMGARQSSRIQIYVRGGGGPRDAGMLARLEAASGA